MARAAASLAASLALLLGACGDPALAPALPAGWQELDPAALAPAQAAQRERALKAPPLLFQRLSQRLMEALGEGGAAGAIEVCQLDAPGLRDAVERDLALRVGRTSFRLRNPANQPPDWAAPYVAARRAEPVWLTHADGRLAGLVPIRLQALCVACHGPAERLADGVAEALAARYPADQATGFLEGDLRGWFWIEVP